MVSAPAAATTAMCPLRMEKPPCEGLVKKTWSVYNAEHQGGFSVESVTYSECGVLLFRGRGDGVDAQDVVGVADVAGRGVVRAEGRPARVGEARRTGEGRGTRERRRAVRDVGVGRGGVVPQVAGGGG